jgi:hypothetical protein
MTSAPVLLNSLLYCRVKHSTRHAAAAICSVLLLYFKVLLLLLQGQARSAAGDG